MALNRAIQSKEDLVLEVFKMTIEHTSKDNLTKESIVEIYNYIYDNIHSPYEPVQIIDDIAGTPDD